MGLPIGQRLPRLCTRKACGRTWDCSMAPVFFRSAFIKYTIGIYSVPSDFDIFLFLIFSLDFFRSDDNLMHYEYFSFTFFNAV